MSADNYSDHPEDVTEESVPSGYRKIATPDGTKIVREGPVSFVRRELSMSPNRQRLWDDHLGTTILPVTRSFADTSVAPESHLDIAQVWGQDAPLIVDVGVGHGESTFAGAVAHPDKNFLAVEVYRPGLAKLLNRVDTENVTNVRMVEANAPEVLDHMLGAGTVSEVWVFFSDPWPKNRYHKRRLIQPKFLDRVARVLTDDGILRLATDWSHYAHQMRTTLDDHQAFENLYPGRLAGDDSPLTLARAHGTDDGNPQQWEDALDSLGGWAPRFTTRPITSFEAKAQRAGRYIFDLAYRVRA
ncbi:tRNA (guanosine(46)-N7)-methyltransferase TrmB [Yaniella halotolerans]|uniref:tRNA (guanosine(46)-N7)-methyltransferase TrmB n=1 Tax=Yaniella halotolerans TaxID=225453 RepID=UPI0003B46C4F|nr:tRNA (guanosine(46)-N7)-methyltransferase TrmB [Yaniella halotolerans]